MKTIYKYPLELHDKQTLPLPLGAEVIHVGLDPAQKLCIWALVNRNSSPEPMNFYILGTGLSAPAGASIIHVGSVLQGNFVWHVFRETTAYKHLVTNNSQ